MAWVDCAGVATACIWQQFCSSDDDVHPIHKAPTVDIVSGNPWHLTPCRLASFTRVEVQDSETAEQTHKEQVVGNQEDGRTEQGHFLKWCPTTDSLWPALRLFVCLKTLSLPQNK